MIHDGKRPITFVLMLFLALGTVFANDVAQFVNLGFSPDSRVFMFAQHGILAESNNPFAEIYTVDVPGNVFIRDGVATEEYPVEISPGQDGSGALFTLLPTVRPVVDRYAISHLEQGRLVYLFVNGEQQPETLEFRDFDSGDRYVVTMTQTSRGEGPGGSAAFHLDITVRFANGDVVEARVGRPDYYRNGVNRYRIKQIIVSPDNGSLIAVVERITDMERGQRIRYMVETTELR